MHGFFLLVFFHFVCPCKMQNVVFVFMSFIPFILHVQVDRIYFTPTVLGSLSSLNISSLNVASNHFNGNEDVQTRNETLKQRSFFPFHISMQVKSVWFLWQTAISMNGKLHGQNRREMAVTMASGTRWGLCSFLFVQVYLTHV